MKRGRILVVVAAALACGCYTRIVPTDGTPPPIALPAPEQPIASAGISLDEAASITPSSAFLTAAGVAERFAARAALERVYAPVTFPYPRKDAAAPDLVLRLTVRMEEKQHIGENLGKAVAAGLTFLLTLPVLPLREGLVVDLSAVALDARGEPIASYAARRENDVYYSFLELPHSAEDVWVYSTADQAIDDLLNQIKSDPRRRPRSVRVEHPRPW